LCLCLFEVANKLSALHKLFAELLTDQCLVELEWHNPIKVLIGCEILDRIR